MPRKTKSKKQSTHICPDTSPQDGAPFDHEEEHPEPMEMDTLDHQDILHDESEWDNSDAGSECSGFDQQYDVSSITMDDDDGLCGSVQSSPGIFDAFERRSVLVEPKSPPGIPVTFDDESWIV
jgi:hypothetical protein